MRSLAIAVAFAAAFVCAPAAFGQTDDSMEVATAPPSQTQPAAPRRLPYGNHWVRCLGLGTTDARGAILSCGRIIGERITRVHTATAYYNRGRHYNELGDTTAANADLTTALRMFTDAIGADPRNGYGYINRATLYEYLERYDDALADYDRAIVVAEDLGHPNYRRGAIFFNLGDYVRAAAEYNEAVRKAPEQQYYHAALCEARAAAGEDWNGASSACAEAIEIAEEDAYVYFSRGFLKFRQGDFEGAFADFSTTVSRSPDSAPGLYGRGVTAMRLGRRTEGEADITRALELDEDVDDFYGAAGLNP